MAIMKVKELWQHIKTMRAGLNELQEYADDLGWDDEDENEMTEKELAQVQRLTHDIYDGLRPIINERA